MLIKSAFKMHMKKYIKQKQRTTQDSEQYVFFKAVRMAPVNKAPMRHTDAKYRDRSGRIQFTLETQAMI